MHNCLSEQKLSAYHDGEIVADERAVLESHVAECAECRERLTQLRAISSLFDDAGRPGLSQISLRRLHHRLESLTDRGLIRLGWTLSGVAASLLVAGSVWLTRMQSLPPSPPPWVNVSLAMDTDAGGTDAASPAAQWYLADASTRVDNNP